MNRKFKLRNMLEIFDESDFVCNSDRNWIVAQETTPTMSKYVDSFWEENRGRTPYQKKWR